MSSTSEYENEWGETIVHWSKQDNPFFTHMPVVHIARAVRRLGDDEVTTPDIQCTRVFARTRGHRVDMNVMNGPEILSRKGTMATEHSFYNMLPFDVEFNPNPPVSGPTVRAYSYRYTTETTGTVPDLTPDFTHYDSASDINHSFYLNPLKNGSMPYRLKRPPIEDASNSVTLYFGDPTISEARNLALTWELVSNPPIGTPVLVETIPATEDTQFIKDSFPGHGIEQYITPPIYQVIFFSIHTSWVTVPNRTYELKSSEGHIVPISITEVT